MEATLKSDVAAHQGDDVIVRLRVDVYDELRRRKGAKTVAAAAELHSLNRSQLFDYRSGRKSPNLSTAMKMAADLDTTVDKLFELRHGGDDRG